MLNAKERRLHDDLLRACLNLKNSTESIVVTLFAVARTKLYRKLKRRSLVEYIVEELKIDSTFTFDLNRVVRASLQYPELEEALRQGRLTVSKATRILGALSAESAGQLIDYAAAHTFAETNSFVAGLSPVQNCREACKQISSDQFRVGVVLTAEQFQALRRVQSLEAQKQKASKMTDAFAAALNIYLERHDPVKKAQRADVRKRKKISLKLFGATAKSAVAFDHVQAATSHEIISALDINSAKQTAPAESLKSVTPVRIVVEPNPLVRTTIRNQRVRLTADEKHQVHLRTGGRCCLVDRNGKRCDNDRWLEIHHRIPVSQGGTNAIENLIHVCGPHHDLIHQEVLPLDDEVTWWTFAF